MPWTLNTLPSEVLGLIISGSNTSFVIVRLWKCGDRLLQSKLSSGSRSVDLKASLVVRTKLPLFFGALRCLTYLSISSRLMIMEDLRDWSTFMFSLPSSLETLCIQARDTYWALLNHAPESTSTEEKLVSTEYPRGRSNLIDLNTLFPRLHTLKLTSSGPLELDPTIEPSNFPGLPSSLTHLTANFDLVYTEEGPNRFLYGLPRSLRELCGAPFGKPEGHNILENLVADFAGAPPSLTSLKRFWENQVRDLDWLPKSVAKYSGSYPTWSLYTARTLPPGFQCLEATTIDLRSFALASTDWIHELPSRLTLLRVRLPQNVLLPLNRLPSSLKKLVIDDTGPIWSQLGGLSEDASKSAKSWPPLLETLKIHKIPYQLINHLPHTLKTLEVSFHGPSIDGRIANFDVSHFPPQLTRLECKMPSQETHALVLAFSGTLPVTIRHVELGAQAYDGGLEHSTLNLLEPREPSGNQSLPMKPLPTFLTFAKLHIGSFKCEWFGHLPRWLKQLSIHRWAVPQATKDAGTMFEGLPPSLEYFYANCHNTASEGLAPSQRLASIVPRLRGLTVLFSFGFPSSFIRELPPTLEELNINLVELREEDAMLLPPKLSYVSFQAVRDWDPKLAKHKPWRSRNADEVSSELASSLSW